MSYKKRTDEHYDKIKRIYSHYIKRNSLPEIKSEMIREMPDVIDIFPHQPKRYKEVLVFCLKKNVSIREIDNHEKLLNIFI